MLGFFFLFFFPFFGKFGYFCAQIIELSVNLSILVLFMCGIDNFMGSAFFRFDECGIFPLTVKALSSALLGKSGLVSPD